MLSCRQQPARSTAGSATIQPAQESIIYDRNVRRVLARFSAGERRRSSSSSRYPPILLDATTAIEDKTFWTNTGFDPLGIVVRGASTPSAAGPVAPPPSPSSWSASACCRRSWCSSRSGSPSARSRSSSSRCASPRRIRGEQGKQQHHRRVPQPELLRQQQLRRADRGARLLRGATTCRELTIAQAAILAGIPQAPGSYDLVRNAEEVDAGDPTLPRCPRGLPRRPDGVGHRAAPQLHPPAARGRPVATRADRRHLSPPRTSSTRRRSRWCS